ncbi:MAG: NAD(P)-dependent oxidoreductase [Austwickia sp.]|nr:NAD(P)-dependent oxidoreductase [Austwickia sp.]
MTPLLTPSPSPPPKEHLVSAEPDTPTTPTTLPGRTVAVLGLGAMGLPMAANLARHGATVRGYDIAAERLALAADAGITPCASAVEAATGADIALLAVRNAAQLEEALYGADGIAAVLSDGAAVVLTSTVGIEAVQPVARGLAEAGHHLVDAPVSGGPVRAGQGDLLVTVGATDAAWESALPVLEAMAGTLVRIGGRPGDGQAMKTVNQLLCGVHIAAAAEALALADALGLDPAKALETLMAGAAASFMLGDRGPRVLQAYDGEGAEVKSRLDIFVKDMGIVTAAAKEAHLATPIAAAAEQLYLVGEARGLAARDDSSVVTVLAPQRRTAASNGGC